MGLGRLLKILLANPDMPLEWAYTKARTAMLQDPWWQGQVVDGQGKGARAIQLNSYWSSLTSGHYTIR